MRVNTHFDGGKYGDVNIGPLIFSVHAESTLLISRQKDILPKMSGRVLSCFSWDVWLLLNHFII